MARLLLNHSPVCPTLRGWWLPLWLTLNEHVLVDGNASGGVREITIEKNGRYRMAVNDFMYGGGDGYDFGAAFAVADTEDPITQVRCGWFIPVQVGCMCA